MIELNQVSVTYPNNVLALKETSIRIASGEFVFIVGPTGAGKSTFLKLLYGEERASVGEVFIGGKNLSALPARELPYFRRYIGVVFQDFGLLPNKTSYENVAFAMRVTGATTKEVHRVVPHALEMVGLADRPNAFPNQLSGGEQQRVAIARALVNDPLLLLADEPTGNLDPDTSIGIVEILRNINKQGTTVVVATHDSAIVDLMQMRVLAFDRGAIVRDEIKGAYRRAISLETPLKDVISAEAEETDEVESKSADLKEATAE